MRGLLAAPYDSGVDLKSLTYTSWARPGISAHEVDAILSSARTNNPLGGISGLLIFNGSAFMQILEGGEEAVDRLAGRLASDPRHSNMSIRDERPLIGRTFPDWSMAYLMLDNGKFIGEAAVTSALNRDLPPQLRNIALGLTHSILNDRP